MIDPTMNEYFVVAPGFNMLVTSDVKSVRGFTIHVANEIRNNGFYVFETEDPNGGRTTATLFTTTHFIVMNKKGFENYKYEQARAQATAQGGRIIS